MKREGRLQIYTGNGKGKTTAMLGLAVRAACSGMRVYIGQFLKGRDYSELLISERFPEITIEQFGTPDFLLPGRKPSPEDTRLAQKGLAAITGAMLSGDYDLVAGDEICVSVHLGLLSEELVLELASARPDSVELVLTGRYASRRMIEAADLVTEMLEVKHYYNVEKLQARRGIEN